MPVLIVDSDTTLRRTLGARLTDAGFVVEQAAGETEALTVLRTHPFDLVLAAWAPAGADRDVLKTLRLEDATTPVVVMCSRDSIEARLQAFASGADDYLARPFDTDELIARARSLLRRSSRQQSHVFQAADLTLDVLSRRVERGGQKIHLTRREFDLLHHLMRNRGQVQPRELLLRQVWREVRERRSNIVEVYIRHLREKMDTPFHQQLIHTVRGVGYLLVED